MKVGEREDSPELHPQRRPDTERAVVQPAVLAAAEVLRTDLPRGIHVSDLRYRSED